MRRRPRRRRRAHHPVQGDTSIGSLPTEAMFTVFSLLDATDWGKVAATDRTLRDEVRELLESNGRGARCERVLARLATGIEKVTLLKRFYSMIAATGARHDDCARLLSATRRLMTSLLPPTCRRITDDVLVDCMSRVLSVEFAYELRNVLSTELMFSLTVTQGDPVMALLQIFCGCVAPTWTPNRLFRFLLTLTADTWTERAPEFERLIRDHPSMIRQVISIVDRKKERPLLLQQIYDVPTRIVQSAWPARLFMQSITTATRDVVSRARLQIQAYTGTSLEDEIGTGPSVSEEEYQRTGVGPLYVVHYLTEAQLHWAIIWGNLACFSLLRSIGFRYHPLQNAPDGKQHLRSHTILIGVITGGSGDRIRMHDNGKRGPMTLVRERIIGAEFIGTRQQHVLAREPVPHHVQRPPAVLASSDLFERLIGLPLRTLVPKWAWRRVWDPLTMGAIETTTTLGAVSWRRRQQLACAEQLFARRAAAVRKTVQDAMQDGRLPNHAGLIPFDITPPSQLVHGFNEGPADVAHEDSYNGCTQWPSGRLYQLFVIDPEFVQMVLARGGFGLGFTHHYNRFCIIEAYVLQQRDTSLYVYAPLRKLETTQRRMILDSRMVVAYRPLLDDDL
jgi:hypothetical protein